MTVGNMECPIYNTVTLDSNYLANNETMLRITAPAIQIPSLTGAENYCLFIALMNGLVNDRGLPTTACSEVNFLHVT